MRIEFERLAEVTDGFVNPSLSVQGAPQIIVSAGITWVELQSLSAMQNRCFEPLLLGPRAAQIGVRAAAIRVQAKSRFKQCTCRAESAQYIEERSPD